MTSLFFPPAGMRVLLVDQWIETGGTMKAAIQLVEKLGATVAGQPKDGEDASVVCRDRV